jgi:mRNA-degrading endonuclease YafQ of YafQ-DinJ toxin-antitoxin module
MSKNKHRQQPIPNRQAAPPLPPASSPTAQIQLGYDPKGPTEPVDIVSSKDGWSEFTLTDGTVVRAKAALLDVKKMVGQYNADGEPIYVLQMTMVNQTRIPDGLKKKG